MNQYWMEIAFEMGCSELECKRKWAILRNCYARTLREERNQKTKRKPWYLQRKLSFLKKYIHPHQKLKTDQSVIYPPYLSNVPQSNFCIDIRSSNSSPDVNQTLLTDVSQCSTEIFDPAPTIDSKDIHAIDTTLVSQDQPAPTTDSKDFYALDSALDTNNFPVDEASNFSTITVKSSPKAIKDRPADAIEDMTYNEAANSNHLFLTSLLPDLNKLSDKKQRVFKRKTIELLELLFEANDEFIMNAKLYE